MLDIAARDGLARQLRWKTKDAELATPGVLFLDGPGIPAFRRGEGFLSLKDIEGKFSVLPGGSWFLGQEAPEGAAPVVPPFPNIPAGLEGAPGEAHAASLESFQGSGGAIMPLPGAFPSEPVAPGAEAVLVGSALELLSRPRRFAEELVRLKRAAGYGRAIYAPGLGEPGHLALLAYCGLDLFDSSPLLAAARRGVRLFPGWRAEAAEEGICHCPACEAASGQQAGGGPEAAYAHNCFSALSEAATVRMAIRGGHLRELVETRLSEPWQVALLRHLDLRQEAFCERYFPVARPASAKGMVALGRPSLTRPEVARFRRRVQERSGPAPPVLLLLPCSARKPYSRSASHRLFSGWMDRCGNPGAVHRVVVTSPLGVVPMELEAFYPADSYDIPVTGDWDKEEISGVRDQLRSFVRKGGYSRVVCHLAGMDFLREALPDTTVYTGGEHSTRHSSLEAMLAALSEAVGNIPKVGARQASATAAAAMCRFQFGEGGEALVEGCEVRRIGPVLRFLLPGRQRVQVGMLQPGRGLLSLTLQGGARLLGRTGYEVEIDDFKPSGTVFAPGVVKAGEAIRPNDEVLLVHKGELRGVGMAVMGGPEMAESRRGTAVRVRHHLSSSAGGKPSIGAEPGDAPGAGGAKHGGGA